MVRAIRNFFSEADTFMVMGTALFVAGATVGGVLSITLGQYSTQQAMRSDARELSSCQATVENLNSQVSRLQKTLSAKSAPKAATPKRRK